MGDPESVKIPVGDTGWLLLLWSAEFPATEHYYAGKEAAGPPVKSPIVTNLAVMRLGESTEFSSRVERAARPDPTVTVKSTTNT